MTRKTRIYLGASASLVVAICCGLLGLRLYCRGITVIPSETNDPTGIGLAYQRQWRVWNLWFTPVHVDVVKKTCACVSARVERASVPFGHSATVSLVVSATGKSQKFEEKALLQIVRGCSVATKVLRIQGQKFAGFFASPDAIRVSRSAKNVHSELMRVQFSRGIPFENVTVHTVRQESIHTEWLPGLHRVSDGAYTEAVLKVTVDPLFESDDYLVFKVRGTIVKTVRVFSI